MSIQATCNACKKTYSLDDSFRGKKARCKKCGNIFVVGADNAAAARKPEEKLQPKSDPVDSGGDLDFAPVKPPESAHEPEKSAASKGRIKEPKCPSCKAPFPAENRICLNCGFDRVSGGRAETEVVPASEPVVKSRKTLFAVLAIMIVGGIAAVLWFTVFKS